MKKLIAKYPGACRQCGKTIEPGDSILWARGAGAIHVDCETARLRHTLCMNCSGAGVLWNNRPCGACDGSGQRDMQMRQQAQGAAEAERCRQDNSAARLRLDNSSAEDRECGDLAYEDQCSRACGL